LGRDAKALRDLATTLLREHLRYLTRLQLDRRANARRLAKASREAVERLAGNDTFRAATYRTIHRAARHNRGVVSALAFSFFHGLPLDELRTRPGLLAKLVPPLEGNDIPLLLKFLFQTGKRGRGLVEQWRVDDALRSPFRNQLAQVESWPWLVQQHRAGIQEAQSFEVVEAQAGEPTVEDHLTEDRPELRGLTGKVRAVSLGTLRADESAKRLKSFAKRRERLGLHYPK